jgi:hypothetical protein
MSARWTGAEWEKGSRRLNDALREILSAAFCRVSVVKIFSMLKVQVFFVIFTEASRRLRKKRLCKQSIALLCKT